MTLSDTPPEHHQTTSQSPEDHSPPNPLRNGVIGGVTAAIISFIPASTVIGGGIAGYLTDGHPDQQLLAGTTAGVIAAIPPILVGWYVTTTQAVILPTNPLGLGPDTVLTLAFVATTVYSIGLTILGSFTGGYLARSTAD